MSYPEWGVGNFGDNPFFIQQMHDWFMKNEDSIAYAAYFDVDGSMAHPDRQRPVSEIAASVPKAVQPLICDQHSFSAVNPVH